ncbi:hypothetical protein E2I00_003632 [Balaenoptera physalus]|uniref:GAIN-B domain-containing protein n=1 Tax=Balaenoptera physalus TaxID=9770 RepID=A0A6A1QKH3_BALPH|nr:hypothetical protein E2I00_003632 [Balaenoptera physalus]
MGSQDTALTPLPSWPVPSEECPTWDPGPRTEGFLFCLQPVPFLCCYRTGILERLPAGLAKETAPLGPAALLAGMHFLKRVAALGTWEPEPMTGPWEQLGQAVVSVASLVLEEQLAGLELRSLHLRETSTEGQVFTMPGGHPEGPGHILIPAAEVRRLLRKGLSGVTMIHSWFSSSVFQYTLGAPGREPQAPDTSEEASRMHRFLSTQVGSAIISSEVWDETGEANTAVTFHLQHWAQAFSPKLVEPVCAFWNFSIGPDSGGSWTTTGCSVTALCQDSTACFCNHSANFAVLLQVYDVQANTCILVRVVTVTVSSARRRARTLSPQPCVQQQIQIQMWATVKPLLVLLPVPGLTWPVSMLVHLSPARAYAAVGLNSLQGRTAPGSPQPSPPLQNPRDR